MDLLWDFTPTPDSRYRPAWFWDLGEAVRVNEQIRKSVVFLGIVAGDQFVPYGTAFVGAIRAGEDRGFTYLITAKHVVEDLRASKRQIFVRVNTKSGGAALGALADEWRFHPTVSKCDVAVTGFVAPTDMFDYKAVDLSSGVLTQEYIEENDVGGGDEVYTSGLLARHFGEAKNIPIVRIGNIAAMPEEPISLGNALGTQEVYLIESRSIGGLSGSPVFLHTPVFRLVKDAAKNMDGHRREYIIGVNIGLFETSVHNDSIPTEVAEKRERFLETMSAGIAIVVPIQRVLEILEIKEFREAREATMERLNKEADFRTSSAAPRSGEGVIQAGPATDNPSHKEDFMRLLGAASKVKPQAE